MNKILLLLLLYPALVKAQLIGGGFPAPSSINVGTACWGQLPFVNGGNSGSQTASASTGTVAVTMNTSIVSVTPSGAITFTSASGTVGQRCTFIVTTSGASSFVVTFGTGFRAVSTLATGTTTAKKFCVSFIYEGQVWIETGRTAAL